MNHDPYQQQYADVCHRLEDGLIRATTEMQAALNDIRREMQNMLNLINEGRLAHGLPPYSL